ncbi:MAG: DegT/DnrJ/EryC1/StrS family aminotransferase [Geitlerinemataceae cyanobacterium]
MNQIPPLDLARQYPTIALEVETAVLKVLASGRYIGGDWVREFEGQFADYIGTTECVSCHSGTDALYLALRSLDIGLGDEVITTALSFFATAETISMVGATPVFVDIDAKTFNLDIDRLEAAITPRTKAILPVHLFGQPIDMTRLMAVADAHHLAVIEDCAQAAGAQWDGKKVGSFGHLGCFSFFPTKNLGAFGDGGAVTTHNRELAAKIRVLKDHGATRRYYHEELGTNSRLDALQAAVLQVKLPYLDGWNDRRRQVAIQYGELLDPLPHIVLPQETLGGRSVWNQYTVRIEFDRDRLYSQLQQSGIGCSLYYPVPLHLQPVYQNLGYKIGQLPVAERACQQVLSLPMFPELEVEQQYQVVHGLKDCL